MYQNVLFFLLLAGATWYYHDSYTVSTYFASFPIYEDDIFKGISNLYGQRSKFDKKLTNLADNCNTSGTLWSLGGLSFLSLAHTH